MLLPASLYTEYCKYQVPRLVGRRSRDPHERRFRLRDWLSNFRLLTRRIAGLLESALVYVVFAIGLLYAFVGMLGQIVLFVGAVIDVVFLGRYGVAVIGGLAIVWGGGLILRKRCPDWYERNLALDRENPSMLLLWPAVGYALWLATEGILPDTAPQTNQIAALVSAWIKSLPLPLWLTESNSYCTRPCGG